MAENFSCDEHWLKNYPHRQICTCNGGQYYIVHCLKAWFCLDRYHDECVQKDRKRAR